MVNVLLFSSQDLLKQVNEVGFNSAFVAAFEDGKRIELKEQL